VKHALPELDFGVPADEWRLSPEGKARCVPLADRLRQFRFTMVACSPELKAVETAQLMSSQLEFPIQVVAELYEHRRQHVRMEGQDEFERHIAQLFAEPGQLVYGEETADQAHSRFADAVHSLVARNPEGNIALIAHGTVITLFVARACGLEPFALWKQLGLPSYIVLDLPGYKLNAIVDQAWS
jgi:broad specificity phosphatase PhoE